LACLVSAGHIVSVGRRLLNVLYSFVQRSRCLMICVVYRELLQCLIMVLCVSGSPSLSLLELPWIVHSRSTVKTSPSILFPGLRMLRQISIEFVMLLRAISLKKPSLCSTREHKLVSNVYQLLSTIITLFSNSIVIEVPMPFLMWLTLHC